MARSLGRVLNGVHRLCFLSTSPKSGLIQARTMVALPSLLSSKPRDFSLPNSSWGTEMMRLYEQYNSQCEVETEGGEKQEGPWRRLPSYNRVLKYATVRSRSVCAFSRLDTYWRGHQDMSMGGR